MYICLILYCDRKDIKINDNKWSGCLWFFGYFMDKEQRLELIHKVHSTIILHQSDEYWNHINYWSPFCIIWVPPMQCITRVSTPLGGVVRNLLSVNGPFDTKHKDKCPDVINAYQNQSLSCPSQTMALISRHDLSVSTLPMSPWVLSMPRSYITCQWLWPNWRQIWQQSGANHSHLDRPLICCYIKTATVQQAHQSRHRISIHYPLKPHQK